MAMTTRVVAVAGSLRAGSLNRRLVGVTPGLAPPGMDLEVWDDLRSVPLFDEDLEAAEPSGPGGVAEIRGLVADHDGLLIATPEYNQSVPGVTKNFVDWLSRPDEGSVLNEKPVAIVGATTGPWGTRYAQKELRHALTAAGAIVMPQPMFFLPMAEQVFDPSGRLTDRDAVRRLRHLLQSFRRWIELVAASR